MKDPPIYTMSWRLPVYSIVLLALLEPCWSTLFLEPTSPTVVKYLNDSYVVTCSTDNYNETNVGAFKWLKNNETLSYKKLLHVDMKKMHNTSMLIFNRISVAHKGNYTCKYQDQAQTFQLIVVSQINFDDTPEAQTIQENREGIVQCPVKGDPKPKVIWKFKGNDLNTNTREYELLPDGLKIHNVSAEDKGIYICRALQVSAITSMYQEKYINVNVQHRPLHKKHPVHAKVNQAYGFVGGVVNLTCEAVAEPAATFAWFGQHKRKIEGRLIEEPHSSVMQIKIENTSMFGDYLCRASNSFGILEQIITLSEGLQPPAPRKLYLHAAGSDSLELLLIPPFVNRTVYEPHMMPTGYRLLYRVKGVGTDWKDSMVAQFDDYTEDDTYPYILLGLAHDTEYEVRAATRNPAGLSEFTIPRTFRTLRLRPERAGIVSFSPSVHSVSIALVGAALSILGLSGN